MNGALIADQQQALSVINGNQEDLLARFIAFIDATPNTVRTYTTSLRQWFKYLYVI